MPASIHGSSLQPCQIPRPFFLTVSPRATPITNVGYHQIELGTWGYITISWAQPSHVSHPKYALVFHTRPGTIYSQLIDTERPSPTCHDSTIGRVVGSASTVPPSAPSEAMPSQGACASFGRASSLRDFSFRLSPFPRLPVELPNFPQNGNRNRKPALLQLGVVPRIARGGTFSTAMCRVVVSVCRNVGLGQLVWIPCFQENRKRSPPTPAASPGGAEKASRQHGHSR